MSVHATSAPGLLYSAPLAGGDDGTRQTIALLRSLVDSAWKDPFVNRVAIEILRLSGIQPYDTWGQIHAIYDFAHSFYFVNDPVMKEALRPTRDLLELMAGDCDDINGNVLPALLGTIGYETRLVTIAADPESPDLFSHVYCEVYIDGEWIPLDAARPGAVFAVAPAHFYRREWWSLRDESHGDYPAEASAEMSGAPRRIFALGSISSDLSAIFQGASTALRSIGGSPVQPVIGSAIGPGGSSAYTPGTGLVTAPAGSMEVLFLVLAGGLIWWGMKD